MDQWRDVTLSELASAMREAELSWAPSNEFLRLGRFNLPPGGDILPRLKCNLWYFRTIYAALLGFLLTAVNVRRPLPLLAVLVLSLGGACLSDALTRKLSQQVIRLIRKVKPHLGERLRAESAGRTGLGAPGKGGTNIAGVPRAAVVAACCLIALLLFWMTGTLTRLAWACIAGGATVLTHAALRAPNLKVRLATQARAREEFRAVWRGYSAGAQHDYNA
ncbi:hypothetical protein WJX81_001221 [Elliptochloris bilobata]|uniref:PRA1 family protein n=1 Tax=Elliptochloris bilobata TaxID=381761 RepID=A0AAW1S0A5_9CHLO